MVQQGSADDKVNALVASQMELPPTPPSEVIMNMLNYPLALHHTDEVYRVTEKDLNRLRRFQDRTVLTIGTAHTIHYYKHAIVALACRHDYLLHVVFAIVLMHDRYLSDNPWRTPDTEETFHHYHGTAMFNSLLSKPIPEEEKDGMWGAAALLGAITIAAVEATTPEDSWPLKPNGPSDLDWLRMSDGKREVWRLADPTREGSVWREAMLYDYDQHPTPKHVRPEVDDLIPHLYSLFQYDSASDDTDDPYHTIVAIILRLLPMRCTHSTILYFLSFIGHMRPEFKELLHQKDDRAMLLTALWYATMMDYPAWWLQRRGQLECKAICVYLSRKYTPWSDVGRLLDFPKAMCGLAVSTAWLQKHDEARSGGLGGQAQAVRS